MIKIRDVRLLLLATNTDLTLGSILTLYIRRVVREDFSQLDLHKLEHDQVIVD